MTQRFIVSWAQSATPVFEPFFQALQQYAWRNEATLKIVAGKYHNPTSLRASKSEALWWWDCLSRYLVHEREQLCPNLCLYADVPTQPVNGLAPRSARPGAAHGACLRL